MGEQEYGQQNSRQDIQEKKKSNPTDEAVDRYNKNFNHALQIAFQEQGKSDLTCGTNEEDVIKAMEASGGDLRSLQQEFSRWSKKVEDRGFHDPGMKGTLRNLEMFCKIRGVKPNDILLDPNEMPASNEKTRLQFLSKDAVRQILNALHRKPELNVRVYTIPILHHTESFVYAFLKIYRKGTADNPPNIYAQFSISYWVPLLPLSDGELNKGEYIQCFKPYSICEEIPISGKESRKIPLDNQITAPGQVNDLWETMLAERLENVFNIMDKDIEREVRMLPRYIEDLASRFAKAIDCENELIFDVLKVPEESKKSPEKDKKEEKVALNERITQSFGK